jgi:chromosome segregation ATPase
VDELTTAILSSAAVRSNALRALSLETLQDKIWHLVRFKPNHHVVCAHVASIHRQLITTTIASLITIVLAAEPGEPALPQTLTMALVKTQRDLPLLASPCPHSSTPLKDTSISLFQAANTQCTSSHLEDWSTRLDLELQSQGKYQRDTLLRSVAQICGDLETRCNTVEEPLRKEREKSVKLEEEIRRLSDVNESLRTQNEDSVDQFEGLENELEDLREDHNQLRQENVAVSQDKERAWSRVKELESLLDESKSHASEALSAAQELFDTKELALRSSILQLEEHSRTYDSQVRQLNETIDELKQSQIQWEKDYKTLTKEHELLQRQYQDTDGLLERERSNSSHQKDHFIRLETQVSEYRRLLEEKEIELRGALESLDALKTMHQEFQKTSEARIRGLTAKHASDVEALEQKTEQACKILEDQLQSALQDGKQERYHHEKSRSQIQQLQQAIPPLKSRIQELEGICQEQEEELEERRAIHRNVLANFGVSSQQPLAIRSTSRSYKGAATNTTTREPRTQRRRKSAFIIDQDITPNATTIALPMEDPATESTVNASPESSSLQTSVPAPKRSRPRPTFKVPTMRTPYTQKPGLASKSMSSKTSPSKRSALRQVSPNRRHTVELATAEQGENESTTASELAVEERAGSLPEIEYADFDTDEEFLSDILLTPGFASGTGRAPDEDEASTSEL